ncbi:MAG: hypothetical protein ACMUHB_03310 [Thermoplasmatota archaeon]
MKFKKKKRARRIAVREVKRNLSIDGWDILESRTDEPGPMDLLVRREQQVFAIKVNPVVYPLQPGDMEKEERETLKKAARRFRAFPARADVKLFSDLRLRELTYRRVR